MEVTDRSEQGNGTFNESVVDSMATPVVPLMSHTELQVALTCIFSLAIPVCIFGLCSNIVNIIVFYRMGFSIPTNISLFCLAIADWLTLAVTIVVVFGRHPAFQNANLIMSIRNVNAVVYPGVSAMGSWITAVINVERACCITFPMKVKRIFTGKTVVCLIVGMVIYQIASGLPRSFAITLKIITSPVTNRTIIVLIDMDHGVLLQSFFFSYSIPTFLCFSIVVVGTIFLVRKFKQSRQMRASMTRTGQESDKISDKDFRLIRSVIFICVVYIIGATPNILISIASGIHPRMKMNDPYFES
ncbi:hypothetical protein RRG08_053206 [Elysia crispata]|uniref:G-protein coupled receptors family 1 profile domain-containing protein n=1 Tax=Elysia crispata TaxID=231223 RepID=A0AAE1EA74_9GAST|nr:hypothetical protein RRG08_053206 [Elysia crispata]